MGNKITDETIEYVGILAKLELTEEERGCGEDEELERLAKKAKFSQHTLTEEEREQAKKDMGRMLDYIDKLNELDTTGVEPMSHVFPAKNVFREDEVTNAEAVEEILRNAPCRKDDMFVVPKTFG